MRARVATVLLLAAALPCAGCHAKSANAGASAAPPPGEAWLTAAQMKEDGVVVEAVDEQPVEDTILTSGKVTFDDLRVAHVYSPVAGRVTKIEAQLGEHVKANQVLAYIESPEIGLASSDVGKAQADLVAAQHDFERQTELFQQHAASERDKEQAEDAYRKAQAELSRAQQKAKLLRAGALDVVSQTFALRSQLEGDVIARNVSPGQEVQGQYSGGSAQELFTVGELDPVWVVADVYEMDSPRVKTGAHVSVKVVAFPNRVFEGKVDWVSGVLDPSTRTSKVRCVFDNKDGALKPEMYATVQISVDEKRALAIPRPAVVRLGDSTVVFLDEGQTPDGRERFVRRPVTVDEGEGGKWLTVTHGLVKGERIVTAGGVLLSGNL